MNKRTLLILIPLILTLLPFSLPAEEVHYYTDLSERQALIDGALDHGLVLKEEKFIDEYGRRTNVPSGEVVDTGRVDGDGKPIKEAVPTILWRHHGCLIFESLKEPTLQQRIAIVRQKRTARYLMEIGHDSTELATLLAVIDAIIEAIYGDMEDLDAIKEKIDRIKADYPYPEK